MKDAARSGSKEEQAMHAYHSSHQHMSEGIRWKSRYMSNYSDIPVGFLPDELTSFQAE